MLLICKTVSGYNTVVTIPIAIVGFGWVTMPIADRTSGPKKIVVLPNDTVDYLNLEISYESDVAEVTKVFIR